MALHLRAIALLVLLCISRPATAADDPDARFTALSSAEWAWRQEQFATDEDDAEGVRPHLPSDTPAMQAARLARWEQTARALAAIPVAQLGAENQVNYAVYKAQIEALIAAWRFGEWEKPLNSDSAFWSDLTFVARRPFTRGESDYRDFISQMGDYPRYFAEQIVNMRAGLARGFTPPRAIMQGRDASIASIANAQDPAATVFYEPFRAMPASIPAATQAELRAAAIGAIRDQVIPAHRTLLDFMRETYLPGVREPLSAESLPDGPAYYRSRIREYTTLDLTPEEIHRIGLAEVAKIRAQMLEVMREARFEGDLPAFLRFLRTDPRFYATSPQALLDRAAWIAKSFDGKASTWFGRLPRARFAIVAVPDDIAPFYTAGRGGPGIYLVNTYDLPARPLYALPALTLHESAPGHAFQMPLADENRSLPEFRRKSYISAYGEGWALYCEKLGVEMGMYSTPYERFGMLSYQMWRAARLVVDTGIHAKRWTRTQAQAFMHDNTALSDHEIETEVDRYIGWPGQALSYYLGEMAIERARAKAEAALGARFDVRRFHDTVLSLGSVPLPVLDARIDRFIAEGGPSPWPDE